MYEGVHARPDGESTVARQALTAAEYGYSGIVVRNHGDQPCDADYGEIAETYGIDVVDGVEVRAEDPSRASGFVGNYREDKTVVSVHGGDTQLNRFAVEQPAVDVLAHPMDGGDFNHVLAKEAARNGVRVEFSLARVLREQGGTRVRAIQDLRKLREMVETYDVPYVVSADPTSHLQLRAPRDLRAVGDVIGFSAEQVEDGLREWGRLAERNRERQSDRYVEPGVRLGEYDDGSE
ncbi:ribonuclease P protein subunit Rpp30 [Halorientalis persicus]|jgi:ribonuclease P/MRP protein subunit RPP1|uniref:Ribonuclease P protein component 3 n=1 Tax=Halorientalis persicus TaxID=1367881 RepID=A0A1H8V9T4_9EURY|nr:RNase P subunit p30 family protein [Halorientalis persicus]SEP12179.1 ribonuclease P protein subunit Rpp30 [Halorientalis persicus]